MRIGLVLGVAVVGALLIGVFAHRAREARRGRRTSVWVVATLAYLILLWLLAMGFAVGYAVDPTVVAGAIGAGVAGGFIMIAGPLVRILLRARRSGPGLPS